MNKRLTIKDHKGELRLFSQRSMAAITIVICFAVLLLCRLFYLQIINHTRYSTLSQRNLLEVLPIAPNRGLIYDRNGIQLAKNIPAFNLAIIPEKVKNLNKTIKGLKEILPITKNDIHDFKRSLKQHHSYQAVPLKMNLSEKELSTFYVNHYRFPGAVIKIQMLRSYPLTKTTSNVVGYVGRINTAEISKVNHINYSASDFIGKTGIEKYYESWLHGTVGAKEVEINANGHVVRVLKRIFPVPGRNLYLTIDSRLQAFAEKTLAKNNGAIVAIQPSTGQILALVTKPNFDPNIFVNGISHHNYEKLVHSPDHPLFNRAIRGQYAPASTIKPFLAIIGLDNKTITPTTKIYDPGWFRLPNTAHIYHDWKHTGHGWVNVTKAIIVSCDTFFYQLAVKLGIHTIDTMLAPFGFGQATQIDMPEELTGLLPSPEWKRKNHHYSWYTGDTILSGIGQGFVLATPLQLAKAAAIIAEHGARYQPHLLLKSQTPDGIFHIQPTIENTPIVLHHPEVWRIVINAMREVVSSPRGTAESFGRHPGYTVAAKTGTAQVYGKQRDEIHSRMNIPKKLRNHHLFISFAPTHNPQIVLVVVVEHASYADLIARRVMDFYFKYCAEQDKVSNEQSTR